MLLGDARIRDERGMDIEKTEHRTIDGERISDERTKNRRAEHGLKLLEDDKSVNPRKVSKYHKSRAGLKVLTPTGYPQALAH